MELINNLSLWINVLTSLEEFQEYWLILNKYFEDSDIQLYLKDENKRYREYDRFFRSILNSSMDAKLVKKLIEICMKTSKKNKNTNYDQLKQIIISLKDFKVKIENYKEDKRKERVNNKLYKYNLRNITIKSLPEILTGIIFRSDFELDDRDDLEDEMYSIEEDTLFIDKKSELDSELDKYGVYNDNIKPW